MHLIGNLNHFIGSALGNTGYVRDRDSEFTKRDVPREKLIADIENTIIMIKTTISKIDENDYEKLFPLKKHDEEVTTVFMMLHLLSHLNYHLGQVNYHRRLLD